MRAAGKGEKKRKEERKCQKDLEVLAKIGSTECSGAVKT